MRKDLEPKEAFLNVLVKTTIPEMGHKATYAELLDRFAFVVVRDTLFDLGISFKKASSVAGSHSGCARARFKKCADTLGFSVTGKCTPN